MCIPLYVSPKLYLSKDLNGFHYFQLSDSMYILGEFVYLRKSLQIEQHAKPIQGNLIILYMG